MKFLCNTEFIHSGEGTYFSGAVYPLTVEAAGKLINLDKKKPLGALSFFTPVDEEAVEFMKRAGNNGGGVKEPSPEDVSKAAADTGKGNAPKSPTRADLIAEAKNLGIKGADRMSVDELKEVIGAKKGEPPAEMPARTGNDKGPGTPE